MQFADRKRDQGFSTDADQVEITSVKYGNANIDSGLFDETIASAYDDFQDEDFEGEWFQRDVASDSAAGGIFSEIERRKNMLGDAYPFNIQDNALIFRPDVNSLTYRFCLVVSSQTNITSRPFNRMPRAFEQVSRLYTQFHFGPYAKSTHTGWPRVDGQPKLFREMVRVLNQETGEWWWGPDEGLENTDANPIKDCGIDFVTWLDSPDGTPGKLFITGQCACGDDWPKKYADVQRARYARWFRPPTLYNAPVKAICVPFALVPHYVREATEEAGIVYERIRFTLLAKDHEEHLPEALRVEMQSCIDMLIEGT